jgi:hypothetical protein
VRYIIVHGSLYPPEKMSVVLLALTVNPQLEQLGHFKEQGGEAVVFQLR